MAYGPQRQLEVRSGMTESKKKAARAESPTPSAALRRLHRLVGTWEVSGDAQGTLRYEWMEGGFFLLQHVDLRYEGRKIRGLEVIGNLHRIGESPSEEVWTRFYSALDGLTLDYVYELSDDELTVWFRHKNSDNFMKARFSPDGKGFVAAWQWPGGGYRITAKRRSSSGTAEQTPTDARFSTT